SLFARSIPSASQSPVKTLRNPADSALADSHKRPKNLLGPEAALRTIMSDLLYRLRQTSFWGDYGSILMTGLPGPRDEASGQIILRRAGPFIPPIVFTI